MQTSCPSEALLCVCFAEFAEMYSAVNETNQLKVNWNEELTADSNQ